MRIVVEIASLKDYPHARNSHSEAVVQLQNYLDTVGERWDQRLVRLAILGKEVYLMHRTQDDLQICEVYELLGDEDDNDNNDEESEDYEG